MYNEENQELGVDLMKKYGFPMGRFLERKLGDEIMFNLVIGTEEDGPFWYGDIAKSELSRLVEMSTEFGKTLTIC